VRKRTVDKLADLTAQEGQVADLAREGMTNPEIASKMFISPRTVEWHLGNIFSKLGITSRKDLRLARGAGNSRRCVPTLLARSALPRGRASPGPQPPGPGHGCSPGRCTAPGARVTA